MGLVDGTDCKENEEASQETGTQNTSKRQLSQDSIIGNETKKMKLVNVFEGDIGMEKKGENESSTEKKKKKKHKDKEKKKKREKDMKDEPSEGANHRSSTESTNSKSGNENIKPLLEMSM